MTYDDVNNEHNNDVIFDRRRLYSFVDFRSKKLESCGSVTQRRGEYLPVLVRLPKCKDDIWIFSHHCPSREVHELECANVVRFYKGVIIRESVGSGDIRDWRADKRDTSAPME